MNEPVYFPLFVDISKKHFLFIGGGNIAFRRIQTILGFTNNLTIVSPKLGDELKILVKQEEIQWIRDIYKQEYLSGADYVLAATNDIICNENVVADCRKLGIQVNACHRKELCDFYFPSIVQKNDLVIGICGSGKNHSLVKETRINIQNSLREENE